MDRASDSGSEGWGFESLPVYQKRGRPDGRPLFWYTGRDSNHLNPTARWAVGRWVGPHRHLTIYFPKEINRRRVPSGVRRAEPGNSGKVRRNLRRRVPSGVRQAEPGNTAGAENRQYRPLRCRDRNSHCGISGLC